MQSWWNDCKPIPTALFCATGTIARSLGTGARRGRVIGYAASRLLERKATSSAAAT